MTAVASIDEAVKGTVVRAPLVAGQPITNTAIVHGDAAGFMAAMLMPGMRAVSITITADSGAGGFILPNDRVDVILTRKLDGNPPRVEAKTILADVRVLAVDQTFKQDKDTKTRDRQDRDPGTHAGPGRSGGRGRRIWARCRCRCARSADSDTPVASNARPATTIDGGRFRSSATA